MVATVPTLFGFTRPLSKPIGWTLKGTRHGRSGTFSTSGIHGAGTVAAWPSGLPLSRWTDNSVMLAPVLYLTGSG